MAIKRAILNSVAALATSIVFIGSTTPVMAFESINSTATTDSSSIVYAVGTVYSGVELNCLALSTGYGIQYVLVGGDPSVLRPGTQVLISGSILTGAHTTCVQGYPLQVVSVTPL